VRLTLYGRGYCHLCEDMERALERLQPELCFTFAVVDVDLDPALERRYGELVPVLEGPDGREICHYFLDLEALGDRLAVK
jgi:hypothetical protein